MSDGAVCQCWARSEGECCCAGVDWRSKREVELEAIVSDYEQHGGVSKAWGELKAENERYKEALGVIAHHACGDCNTDKLGSEFCNGCEVGIAKQALKETQ